MCLIPMKIKSVSPAGQKYSFIPCGKCAECRKSYQSQWFFRLAVEMQKAQERKWHIGFFTLTYNDEHLPHIPKQYSDNSEPCFRRSDVRRLILRLRKEYFQKCGIIGLRYLIASEFGETTSRPHYHGVIAFPPSIEPNDMLEKIEHFWSTSDEDNMQPLGFVFPSEKVYAQEKFVCKSAYGAAAYASKYCCKDVAHESLVAPLCLPKDVKRECCSFHIQSRSLGLELIKDMTLEQKYKLYTEGLQLVGSSTSLSIPLYIKNKLFFDPDYQFEYDDNGKVVKRLVRRQSSAFLKRYASEIYSAKVDFYKGFFEKCFTRDYWCSLLREDAHVDDIYQNCLAIKDWFHGSVEWIAQYYVSYFGVPVYARSDELVSTWLSRYEKCFFEDKLSYERTIDDKCIDYIMSCHRLRDYEKLYAKMRELDCVLDYHHNH